MKARQKGDSLVLNSKSYENSVKSNVRNLQTLYAFLASKSKTLVVEFGEKRSSIPLLPLVDMRVWVISLDT
jgi:hypothetical protein